MGNQQSVHLCYPGRVAGMAVLFGICLMPPNLAIIIHNLWWSRPIRSRHYLTQNHQGVIEGINQQTHFSISYRCIDSGSFGIQPTVCSASRWEEKRILSPSWVSVDFHRRSKSKVATNGHYSCSSALKRFFFFNRLNLENFIFIMLINVICITPRNCRSSF